MGLSPVSARIYIYLLLSPQHEVTFEEFTGYFKVSKSAVSNALKYLMTMDMVSAKTKDGQRRRYFSADFSKITKLDTAITRYRQLSDMLEDIRGLNKKRDTFSKELQQLNFFLKFMIEEYPKMIERWEKTVARAGKSG